jgi:hypothetical protein
MIAESLSGSKAIAAASLPSFSKIGFGLVVVGASTGIGVLVGLSVAAGAAGFYMFRKLSRAAEQIT